LNVADGKDPSTDDAVWPKEPSWEFAAVVLVLMLLAVLAVWAVNAIELQTLRKQ
jgi:hypothetical protein